MQDQRLANSEELVLFKIEFVAFPMIIEACRIIPFPCLVVFLILDYIFVDLLIIFVFVAILQEFRESCVVASKFLLLKAYDRICFRVDLLVLLNKYSDFLLESFEHLYDPVVHLLFLLIFQLILLVHSLLTAT